MSDSQLCRICGKRRARRPCPALPGDICPICCGTEREVSLSCPLTCTFLVEARRHEKPEWTNDPESYEELKAGETLIREDEVFVQFCMYSVVKAALETPGCVDLDAIAGLAACIQTHKTLDSGLVYESKAADPVAAQVQAKFEAALADYANELKETDPLRSLRNSKILTALIFLHHLGKNSLNGRPRGRHFIDMLRKMAPPVDDLAPDKGSLISLS